MGPGTSNQHRRPMLWLRFGLAAGGAAMLIAVSTLAWVAAQARAAPSPSAIATSPLDETIATRSRLVAKVQDQIRQLGCDAAADAERALACKDLRATLAMFERQIAGLKRSAGRRWTGGGEVIKTGNILDFLFKQVPGGQELKRQIEKNLDGPQGNGDAPGAWQDDGRGIYRTMCVRLCDGYYWPISNAASRGKLDQDEAQCQSSCNSPAKLFYYPNGRGGPQSMIDRTGKPYGQIPNAFRHRVEYLKECRCKPDPWTAEARAEFSARTDDPSNAVAVAEANAHPAVAEPDYPAEPQAALPAEQRVRQQALPNREKARQAAQEQKRSWNPFDRVFGLW